MAPSTTIISDKLFDIAKETGIISLIKNKLFNAPGTALAKLEIVIEEISKIYNAINSELTNYVALYFEEGSELHKEIKTLYTFQENQLKERLNTARGHCGKITFIYRKHLNKWFSRALLSPKENTKINTLFNDLENSDQKMMQAIDEIAAWLKPRVEKTIQLVDSGKLNAANKSIKKAKDEIAPLRDNLQNAMNRLHTLRNEFMKMA